MSLKLGKMGQKQILGLTATQSSLAGKFRAKERPHLHIKAVPTE